MLLPAIIITILVKYVSLQCAIDKNSLNVEWQQKLTSHIRCINENELPNVNLTKVAIKFILKSFFFDKNEVEFTIHSLMFFVWDDPRLKWIPDDYGGIDYSITHSLLIWTPFRYLYQAKEIGKLITNFRYHTPNCQIMHTGRVVCVSLQVHTTSCSSKLHNWPYDIQECSFKFFTSKDTKDKVVFTFNATRGLTALGAEYGSGWDIIDYEVGENATAETKIYLNFVVERQALGCAAMIVIPSFTVAILTLASMILGVKSNIRFGLSIFNLICNFFLLKGISEIVPHQGYDTPSILYFVHALIYVTACDICLLLILNSLTRKVDSPHPWIINFNDYLLNNRIIKHVVFGKWLEPPRTSPNETDYMDKWTDFTIIINSLMFFIILIVILISFLVYIPQPTVTE